MRNCEKIRKHFFLAVNTGFVADGLPDARCREFYHARSGNGLHCSIVGNVVTPGGVSSNHVCAQISEAIQWQELAEAITDAGAIAGIQLASAWPAYHGMRKFVAPRKEDAIADYKRVGASISKFDINAAFDGLFRGSELAIRAGYRHIQLHAAHGYLFNILIDPLFSHHTEIAGEKICQWVREVKSMGAETSIRVSMWTGDTSLDQSRDHELMDHFSSFPVDYIDVSAGFYNINKRLIYPATERLRSERVSATLAFAERHPDTQIILSGQSSDARNDALPLNVNIGICRDLIANPNYLNERSRGCKLCMKCHYYSRGELHLTCGKWNDAGKAKPVAQNAVAKKRCQTTISLPKL